MLTSLSKVFQKGHSYFGGRSCYHSNVKSQIYNQTFTLGLLVKESNTKKLVESNFHFWCHGGGGSK